ncbi:hypothetical protein Tco_0285659 [Tanacetum coccineum]
MFDPSVNTASSYELDSPKDMFKLGASHTLETTHVEFFSDEDEPEVDLGNIIIPIHIAKAISDSSWVKQDALQNFLNSSIQQVWKLMDLPNGKNAIGIKWKSAFYMELLRKRDSVTQPPGFKDPDQSRQSNTEDGIFISQDKYVAEILNKFNTLRCKLMIGSLDVPTASRDSPFELVAYTDSDYARATQDRKSTIGGCQFLGNRLISWQCKKQTVVATSTTKAEYVAAASCCGQVLWIQNQLLDYRYNFMNTVINIDNNNLLTKGFDAGRFQYLVTMYCMLNPYVSTALIFEKFCKGLVLLVLSISTAKSTARTTDDIEVEITASIDGQVKTITEASLRRHLKLEDSDDFPLFPTMITTPESSPSRITSLLSLSPQPHQSPQSSPLRDITKQAAKFPHSLQDKLESPQTHKSTTHRHHINSHTQTQVETKSMYSLNQFPPYSNPSSRHSQVHDDAGGACHYRHWLRMQSVYTKFTDILTLLENDMQ